MGGIVEYQIRYAIEALRSGDAALVNRVIHDEVKVNQLERDIDEACTQVIARRAPAANDLRFLMMVYKTLTDLERIGDEAKKIALVARGLRLAQALSPGMPQIERVAALVIDMLRRALDGLARLEAQVVPDVVRLDDEVDEHFKGILRQLLTYMIEDPRTISRSIDVIFVAKSLERVGEQGQGRTARLARGDRGRREVLGGRLRPEGPHPRATRQAQSGRLRQRFLAGR
jgi:phosphate transport system protein